MKAIEQYFHVVLFIMLHFGKVVISFSSQDETLPSESNYYFLSCVELKHSTVSCSVLNSHTSQSPF